MFHVVCLIEDRQSEIRITWSDGIGAFDGYSLAGVPLTKFREHAAECRNQLDEMVRAYIKYVQATTETDRKERDLDLRQTCFSLAGAGHKLYERLFAPAKKKEKEEADNVREWLEWLRDQNQVDALEVVLGDEEDGDPGVPWTVVYDKSPQQEAFLSGNDHERWRPFWGLRYNLAAGKRVDPLRRALAPEAPTVRIVVDEDVMADLGKSEENLLRAFAAEHNCGDFITTEEQLSECLSRGRPSVLYWLSHASPAALLLGGKDVTPENLYELLEESVSDAPGQFPGLVFLNACQTGMQKAPGSSFLLSLYQARCCGLIATEHSTVDTFASPLGLEFLRAFLDRGEPVGEALRGLRLGKKVGGGNNGDEAWVGGMPMGLVYASFCPPHICKARPAGATEPTITQPQPQPQPGRELIRGATSPASRSHSPLVPLPKHPYRSLSYYDRDDRALFAGRDGDVLRFARILDESATRVLVLHGESGCGKSSFLRAGVIPFLEEECIGYRFMHDRSAGGEPTPLFIRATNDLPGQIADALVKFCDQPLSLKPPRGQPVQIDLPAVLGEWRDVPALRQALFADAALLGRMLADLGQRLPYTPVLVIDQVEEVFTLAREKGDEAIREEALEMLRQAAETVGRYKVVTALRTEYYGRFVDGLRRGVRPAYGVREYLLSDFNETQLTEAILRPTNYEQYGFRYAVGVAERLAGSIVEECRNRQDSVLPLAQVICTQLYDLVNGRTGENRVIGQVDIDALGGVKGGMKRHVNELLARLLTRAADRKAFQKLLTRLYLTQPDGTLTTALMPITPAVGDVGSVEGYWAGRMPLTEMVELMTRPDVRLLRKSTLRLGGGEQRHYLSLGHDALAPVAAEWRTLFEQETRRSKWLLGFGAASSVAIFMTILTLFAYNKASEAREAEGKAAKKAEEAESANKTANDERDKAKKAEADARRREYLAQMNLAQRAWEDKNVTRLVDLLNKQMPKPGLKDLRGFEWYYWWRKTHAAILTLKNGCSVRKVTFSPDGKRIASVGEDGMLRVWDAAKDGEPSLTFGGADSKVREVGFSPDGERIASVNEQGTIQIWDARGGGRRQVINIGHVTSMAFSPNGKQIASSGDDGMIRVWDVIKGGELLLILKGHNTKVTSLAFRPDSKRIISGDDQGRVLVWDAEKGGEPILRFSEKNSIGVKSLIYSSDGKRIASLGLFDEIEIWDAEKGGKSILTLGRGYFIVGFGSMAFSPNGKRIASGAIDKVVVWDAEKEGEPLLILRGSGDQVTSVAYSPDGTRIVSGNRDGMVRVWDAEKGGEVLPTFKGSGGVAFSPDGKWIASGATNAIVIWNLANGGKSTRTYDYAGLAPLTLAFSPDGKRIASGARGGIIRVWDTENTEAKDLIIKTYDTFVYSVAFSPDGKRIVSGGQSRGDPHPKVKIWNAELEAGPILTLSGHLGSAHGVESVAFSPDGKWIASGGSDQTVRVWDAVKGGELLRPLKGHKNQVTCVAISPDGKWIASGSLGGGVLVWDVNSGELHQTLKGEDGTGEALRTCVAFSPDGERIASGSRDRTVRIWDTRLGEETITIKGINAGVSSISWSPDGERIVVLLDDSTLTGWYAPRLKDR